MAANPDRAENVRRAHELRAAGVSSRQIADRLGVAVATAKHYLSDPDGAKAQAYRAGHRGECDACGAPTHAAGVTRCRTHARNPGPPRLWTREQVVSAIRLWTMTYGEPPRCGDWDARPKRDFERRARVRRLKLGREQNRTRARVPTVTTVYRLFGSWNAAIAAAGYEPRPASGRPRPHKRVCAQGHDLSAPESRYVYPDGHWACRVCRSESQARYNAKRRRKPTGLLLGERADTAA